MKKYFAGLLGIFILWIACVGCSDNAIEKEIKNFVQAQERYVNEKSMDDYMNTISKKEPEYVAEKQSWMRDIQNNDIENYRLKIEEINVLNAKQAVLRIIQSYMYKGKSYEIQMPLVLRKEKGFWKDHDLMFKEMQTKHFKTLSEQFSLHYFTSSK
jgi:hypothetical protein